MGRLVSLLGGLLCLGLAGASGHWAVRGNSSKPIPVKPTGLVIEPPAKQFGEVSSSDVLWAEATIRNPFDRPITIEDVSKSCSCVESDVGSRELPAGGSTALRVGWRMAGKWGPVRETVNVRYRVGEESFFGALTLSAVVKPNASFTPHSLRFGRDSDPAEQTVVFTAERSGVDVVVQEVTSSTDAIRTSIDADGRTVRALRDPTKVAVQGIRHTLLVRVTGFDSQWVEVPLDLAPQNAVN